MPKNPSLKKIIEGGERRMFAIARKELELAASEFQAQAQRNIGAAGLVKTGNLHDSVRAKASRLGLQVGTTTDYGSLYNFGGDVKQLREGEALRKWRIKKRAWANTELMRKPLERVAARVAKKVG